MALSTAEQRALRKIELRLEVEDPRLARLLAGDRVLNSLARHRVQLARLGMRMHSHSAAVIAVIAVAIMTCFVVVGFFTSFPSVGIAWR